MIVRTLGGVVGTDRDVKAETWNSRRLLLKQDGMGFSMHDTLIHENTETLIHYRHHLEAVYCIEGDGEVEVISTGERIRIGPGTLYALDGNEKHMLRARGRMRMICVFNPPLSGQETHDADGVYPLIQE